MAHWETWGISTRNWLICWEGFIWQKLSTCSKEFYPMGSQLVKHLIPSFWLHLCTLRLPICSSSTCSPPISSTFPLQTHTNPCFYKPGGNRDKVMLPKDKPKVLFHNDVFGLLPDKLYFRVVYLDQIKEGICLCTDKHLYLVEVVVQAVNTITLLTELNSKLT